MLVDIGWPMLVNDSNHGIGVNFVNGHCHDGVAGGEARIVGPIFAGGGRDAPTGYPARSRLGRGRHYGQLAV